MHVFQVLDVLLITTLILVIALLVNYGLTGGWQGSSLIGKWCDRYLEWRYQRDLEKCRRELDQIHGKKL